MRKLKKGFTIVELVIVIGVIAILSAILIPTFVNLSSKANTAKAKQEVADAYTLFVLDCEDGKLHNEDEQDDKDAPEAYAQGDVYIVHTSSSGNYVYTTEWAAPGTGVSYSSAAADDYGTYNGCHIYKKTVSA